MKTVTKAILSLAFLSVFAAAGVYAGPPFLTDDPEPVDLHHWEAYLFGLGDHTSHGAYGLEGPAVELNYGALPNTQLHLIVPMTTVGGGGARSISGLGDTEFGVKYRFVEQTNGWPQIGIFPMLELPTGDANRGLGNGEVWYRLPVWIQEDFGNWTTYGGGGVALNFARGQRSYPFGGWLLQRDIGKHLTLGGELWAQGSDASDSKGYAGVNLGGYYKCTEHFDLLFSAGHSFAGDEHTLWYFAFYWTW